MIALDKLNWYEIDRIAKTNRRFSFQGAGTAIGELPPYFMARAARLSGQEADDDEFEEIEELIHEKEVHPQDMVRMLQGNLGCAWSLKLVYRKSKLLCFTWTHLK